MKIHKEGYKIIVFFFLLIVTIFVGFTLVFPVQTPFHIVLYVIGLLFWVFILRFFRYPSRQVEISDNNIYSPADGKIVVIERVVENEYFNDERIQLSIFMSAHNVHINWYPISGIVKYLKYHAGSHLIASHPKSSSKNERTSLLIESSGNRKLLIRQIAGMVARRIVYYCIEGDMVSQGKQLGFIKFGSRVDIFFPTDIKLNVELNQKVTGAKTVLATFE
ncbi:MAG: phosphatidylserine decarboxylase family protein [Bacteroidales bacterium]|nr:phosphatidylserine decarboxylase family protein [Bacteroidales bacterium]